MEILLWHIYWVRNCEFTVPDPKDKMVIPVGEIDGHYLGFFINSHMSDLVRSNEHLLQCQGYLRKSDHSCLKYDSMVSCDTAYPFKATDFDTLNHAVSEDAKQTILNTVRNCTTLLRREKRAILTTDEMDDI